MKAVIMAGGKGTRMGTISRELPKPMVQIEGKPVIERQIDCLKDQGITQFILTVGYLGEQVIDYFGDGSGISPSTGQPFGVQITYYQESRPLGNAGALFQLRDQLTEDFLLLNGDLIFDIDLARFVKFHKEKGGLATVFAHPNDHPYDSTLLIADADQSVKKWLTTDDVRPRYYQNWVNAGLYLVSPDILQRDIGSEQIDLDREVLKPLAGKHQMFCYTSPEYVKDMGTPQRYAQVCEDVREGRVQQKNFQYEQRAVFLDRDGTINQYAGFVRNPEELQLIDGAAQAIRQMNQAGYLCIVVTNQPVIARGEVTVEGLQEIHQKMETLLGQQGAYVDAIYYCPHHPDKGYAGEIPELKINCNCRKPKPGMLWKAAQDFHINLGKSWMVGDEKTDIMAGKAAGCRTVLIGKTAYGQDMTVSSLLEFSEKFL